MFRRRTRRLWWRRCTNSDAVEGPRGPQPPVSGSEVSPSGFGPGMKRRLRRYRNFNRIMMSITAFDRMFWRHDHPDEAKADEKDEEAAMKALEAITITPEEAEKAEELTISEIDFNVEDNSTKHHTNKYHESAKPVLRRGQEFVITVTFDRVYHADKDDLIFIFKADDVSKTKNLYIEFKLDENGKGTYKKDGDWGAKILKAKDTQMWVEIYTPGDCVVGQWKMEMKTSLFGKENDYVCEFERPIFILFNPWSEKDQVFYTGKMQDLEEYVLNQFGAVFRGASFYVSGSSWTYDQFKEGILEACLSILRKSYGYRMSVSMEDPIDVSRALSRIVNSVDDLGVVVGNWTGCFEGGTSPSAWTSSADILREYVRTKQPVKYGQCWVFSHVLTAVCRSLGLPCRSVTNFDSAHDTDNTCTVDDYKTRSGECPDINCHDSVWNFHVWNEVWIRRPECPKYEGWHVIDATPQERSLGMYQCGPCPVEAVKQGDVTVGYDTSFVFSEVNADRVFWTVLNDGSLVVSRIETNGVGHAISTKKADGKPFERGDRPVNITSNYKYPEGSKEERKAVQKAVRFKRHGRRLYEACSDVTVNFDTDSPPNFGEDIVVKATVKNESKDTKKITMTMAARSCRYWDRSKDDKHLALEDFKERTLKPGQTDTYKLDLPEGVYMDKLCEDVCFFAYACAYDVDADMPSSAEKAIVMKQPDLDIQGPKTAKAKEVVTVTVSLTNVLRRPLTKIKMTFSGDLDPAKDDKNEVKQFFWCYRVKTPTTSIAPQETFTVTMRLVDDSEFFDFEPYKKVDFSITCSEFPEPIKGVYKLQIQ